MATNKIYDSFKKVVADIPDGATIFVGGWGAPGDLPDNLTAALRDHGAKNLTIICTTSGTSQRMADAWGKKTEHITPNSLIENKQVKEVICSISFPNTAMEKAVLAGEIKVEWSPQGTLAERIRAGGAGLGGFYTRTGVGTVIAEGKEKKIIDGKEYILELPLKADYALIRAYKADKLGNLIYRGMMNSFNALEATAARITIAEVDDIVEIGELDPSTIITQEIFVNRIVKIPKEKQK
ncbi:CoA transferase subunit A [Chloroflexota bacterium]